MLIPLRLLMKLRMSRILALVKLTGALAQLLDERPWPRGFDALPDRLIELRDLCRRLPVARIVLARDLVFAAGRLELILLLEVLGLVEVCARRGELRALQRDLVIRVVGRGARRGFVELHRLIQIPGLHGGVPAVEGLAGRAPGQDHRKSGNRGQLNQPCACVAFNRHRTSQNLPSGICNLKSAISRSRP
jgi:hypothetical protein